MCTNTRFQAYLLLPLSKYTKHNINTAQQQIQVEVVEVR